MACVLIRVLCRVQLVGERAFHQGLTGQRRRSYCIALGGLGKGPIHRVDRIYPENRERNQEEKGNESVHNE